VLGHRLAVLARELLALARQLDFLQLQIAIVEAADLLRAVAPPSRSR
jgi:hypothetical protein